MTRNGRTFATAALLVTPALVVISASCGGDQNGESTFDAGRSGEAATLPEAGGDGPCIFCSVDSADGHALYADFPTAPVLDAPDGGITDGSAPDGGGAAPPNAPQLFGGPSQGAQTGGPCLIEPEVGSLYPKNWLRPRFRWIAANGENLFELRLHVANQVNDLVVYTTAASWTMPKPMWDLLSTDSNDVPMTVSIRGGVFDGTNLNGAALGSNGSIGVAPVDAPGTIVYWSILRGPWTALLKGFAVGDETVANVLTPAQVTEYSTGCIGCHNSTPDGKFVSFSSQNGWQNGLADVEPNQTGTLPPWLGAAGRAAVETAQMGIHTFSKSHWASGDRIEISAHDPNDNGKSELVWIDLEAQSGNAMGTLARTNDARHAGAPSWSHDGTTIAYVSTDANKDGRLDDGEADIYLVPYANKAGGSATPLPGASDPGPREYYPAFSPDDRFLAYNKAAAGNMYDNSMAELYVIPGAGGSSTRLLANDPPACTGKTSPGVTNSWAKWAPDARTTRDGRTFYWAVFSSKRSPAGNPQLYVTPIVVDSVGTVTTYHALYLWNQPADEDNHTPAWDYFMIPPLVH